TLTIPYPGGDAKTAAIVPANDLVIHMVASRWPSKIKALFTFIRLIRGYINLVDKHPTSLCTSLCIYGCKTRLWVNPHSIPSQHAAYAQQMQLFWTALSLPREQRLQALEEVFHKPDQG
ncbi:hypothetical protein VUJ49_26380, partial [Pseudomonas berkeleyensis]|uniref:hypothetical protein n=1 Tax=Pseudomonas berkeleyensis TaxID=2726956 RepID=UPI001EE2B041